MKKKVVEDTGEGEHIESQWEKGGIRAEYYHDTLCMMSPSSICIFKPSEVNRCCANVPISM